MDGFGEDLKQFSGDWQTLVRALAHMFVLESFFVAQLEGEIARIVACMGGEARAVRSDRRNLVRHLGLVRGTVARLVFRKYFEKPPERTGRGVAAVGFVATASAYRGQGVAAALLQHIHAHEPYDEFVLEAADNNRPALELHRRLGYTAFKWDRQRFPKLSGFEYWVHVVYRKGPEQVRDLPRTRLPPA